MMEFRFYLFADTNYIYFIAKDLHLIAYIQCNIGKNALRGMVLNDTSQSENDLNIISCLSKAYFTPIIKHTSDVGFK